MKTPLGNFLTLGVVVLVAMINRRHPMMHEHGGHHMAAHAATMEHMGQVRPGHRARRRQRPLLSRHNHDGE